MKSIIFSTSEVQSVLLEQKTVTRRVVKPQQFIGLFPDKCKNGTPEEFLKEKKYMFKPYCDMTDAELIKTSYKPPYQPGDILYVRETWHKYEKRVGKGEGCHIAELYGYKASIANSEDANEPWKPSIHMPKEAARIWLKVKDVRVERLNDISPDEAVKEGTKETFPPLSVDEFRDIWNSTIKKSKLDRYGWDANPWVWVIEFERYKKPEDF